MKKILSAILFIMSGAVFAALGYDTDFMSDYYPNRIVDNGEYLWIASGDKVVCFDKSSKEIITELSLPQIGIGTIISNTPYCLYKNKEGSLLISGLYNIYKYDNGELSALTKESDYPKFWTPIAIISDSDGKIWGATTVRHHIFSIDGDNITIDSKTPYYDNNSRSVLSAMAVDASDNLWVVSSGGDYYDANFGYREKGTADFVTIYSNRNFVCSSIATDKDGNVWFCCSDGIRFYNITSKDIVCYSNSTDTEIPSGFYSACDVDSEGNLWFSSSDTLLKYDGNRFTSYTCADYNQARSILCDGSAVWIYTKHNDLLKFENGEFSKTALSPSPVGVEIEKAGIPIEFSMSFTPAGCVYINGNLPIYDVCIYDLAGRLVTEQSFGGESDVTLSIPGRYIAGTYIVKLRHSGGETILKGLVM